ncbi:hypothetical protein I5677_15720 [Mobilitalea sibirica]|uniref:Uncharacterized protein n=1 Tax=Mobilitalea sibirica TaxID=1462919 RepID=A0A8J7HCH2_9FIRM|nr:hypothetical protein [Mobilitalea sibirica]MBH1942350.1 hypothetical protein [Mobilitalea sibirica]
MAKETVQAVRQAELNAAQIEKDANLKKDAILMEAQQKATNLISSMTKEAQDKAAKALKDAELRGAEMVEAAKLKAEKEIMLMNEMLKDKEKAAIKLVISEVI